MYVRTTAIVVALVATFATAGASAQQIEDARVREGSFEIALDMGGYFFLDSEPDLKNTFGYALSANANFTRRFGVQIAFEFAPREVNQLSFYQLHADFIYHPVDHPWAVPFLGLGPSFSISTPAGDGASDTDPGFNIYAGIDMYPWEYIGFRLQARYIARFGSSSTAGDVTAHDMLATFGLVVAFGGEKEKAPVLLDTDGDGLLDDVDACPAVPGVESAQGCPDEDGDTIADSKDACPKEAGPAELGGCPDKDGDTIIDKEDRCPDKPGTKPNKGCPDTDGDELVDLDDRCPIIPGKKEYQGCPPPPPEEVVKKFSGRIEGITFEYNQDVIKPESFPVLDEAVKVLLEYPQLRILIEGHTSSEGEREHNLDLSARRALSVKKYLVEKGVDTARVETQGFGPDRPVGDNGTEEGREQNRRIEFKILRQ